MSDKASVDNTILEININSKLKTGFSRLIDKDECVMYQKCIHNPSMFIMLINDENLKNYSATFNGVIFWVMASKFLLHDNDFHESSCSNINNTNNKNTIVYYDHHTSIRKLSYEIGVLQMISFMKTLFVSNKMEQLNSVIDVFNQMNASELLREKIKITISNVMKTGLNYLTDESDSKIFEYLMDKIY
jgi:hypothetical protein